MSSMFCVMPWYGLEIGKKISNCCWLDKNHNIDEVKKDLLNGVKSKWCNKCWNAEDNGDTSRRLQQNILLDTLTDKSIETLENDVRENKNKTIWYSVHTSNKCNGACVTCGPISSSKWSSLLKEKTKTRTLPDVDSNLNYGQAKFIEFCGGEPLLENKNLEILEKLINIGNTECVISMVTNGNVALAKKHIDILSQFKKVIICLSIDGVGPVFEYMRWPLKWDLLLQNLELFKSKNFEIAVSYTLSNINLPFKDKTVAWLENEKLPYIINNVVHPWYFSPDIPISNETTQQMLDAQDKLKGIDRNNFLNLKTS